MENKKPKWLKPLIICIVVAALAGVLWTGINCYLASRSVTVTSADIMTTLSALSGYLTVLGVILLAAVIVSIAVIKLKKPVRSIIRWQMLVAGILAVVVIVNMVCMGPEYSLINNALGDQYHLTEETIAASEALVEEISEEGMVLLKNENYTLPLTDVTKLNVFGWSSTNPIYGGTGSGSVDTTTCVTLLQGLENAGFELNTAISDFYTQYCSERPKVEMGGQDWTIPEPTLVEYEQAGVFESAKEFSDTAVIVIGRTGGENADLPTSISDEDTFSETGGWAGASGVRYSSNADDIDPSKSYLELSNREQDMVRKVTSEFDNVIVVINSANAMELGWLDQYDSIKGAVWCAGPGQTGFDALGKIMNGSINPSGRLVDTYVYDLLSIPAINYVADLQYDNMHDVVNVSKDGWLNVSFTNYVEGIYVGYKYYETAAAEGTINYADVVQFPFGYGLSYTSFEQNIAGIEDDGTEIAVKVNVKNTGNVEGKEVVELYYTPPYTNGGIEKADVNLIQYEKTGMLKPGAEETVTLTFAKEDMASYDYSKIKTADGAYVLEAGDYGISIRSDSHTVLDSAIVTVKEDVIYDDENNGSRLSDELTAVNQFDYALGDITYLSRADHFANYDLATAAPVDFSMSEEAMKGFYSQATFDAAQFDSAEAEMPVTGAKNGITIKDMAGLDYDDETWDLLLDELTVSEMNTLIATGGYAIAKTDSIGLPALIECDGPASIKNNFTGQAGTAFPAATMIAATWSKELATKRGEMMGQQCQDMNVAGWYGPAMNIHRTPFSGRNFEYYSEDGVLSGYMGASEITGARKYNVQTYMKHFALNDSETNRTKMLCTWTNEQAMREIYLKPFELSTKSGGSTAAMTSFNYIGNVWAGANPQLLQTVLRDEWGFEGVTVSDWFSGNSDGYMLADAAVRVGGDRMLSSQGDPMAYVSDTGNASTVTAMRNASHNILYSVANSNAMDDRNFKTPGWVRTVATVDAAAGILLVLIEVYAVMKFMRSRKKEDSTVRMEGTDESGERL